MIGPNGEQVGIVTIASAVSQAEAAELDLVEIAPTAVPPVCRIMDYGKFKYRESKKRHEAKLKQKQIVVKEVKFRPSTDEGDYKIKLRNLTKFLEEGDKTKVTLRFRGREMAHQEFGLRLIERVKNDLEPFAVIEQYPKMEGRQMVMVLSPKQKVLKPAVAAPVVKKPAAAKPAAATAEPAAAVDAEPVAAVVAEPVAVAAEPVAAVTAEPVAAAPVVEEKK